MCRAWTQGRQLSGTLTLQMLLLRDVHRQPRLEVCKGPFRAAFKSLFLVLATFHGGGKGQVSSF